MNDYFQEEEEEDTQEGKFLTFRLEAEDYGIEIRRVMEIIGIQKITPLPDLPVYFKGVINLRGKVIPVIDVRLKFGMTELAYHDRTCIIVTQMEDYEVGLIVDRVDEVIDIPADKIEQPPRINRSSRSRYIQGMGNLGERVIIILNVDKFLSDEEARMISETEEQEEALA